MLSKVMLSLFIAALPVAAFGAEDVASVPNFNAAANPVLPNTGPQSGASVQQQKATSTPQPKNTSSKPGYASGRGFSVDFDKAGENKRSNLPDFSGEVPTIVLPEVTTSIRLSASDLNRISCQGEIKEALTSTEKGVMIKIQGRDAFVKFKVTKRSDGQVGYSTTPAEVYIVCDDNTYSMIAFPQRIPSQTIKLSGGIDKRIKENQSIYAGLPHEKRVLKALKDVYTDNFADSYLVSRVDKQMGPYKNLRIVHRRTVDIEGEGMRVKEYEVTLKPGIKEFKLSERLFIKADLAENPIAISIERPKLGIGDMARVFVLEQRAERAWAGLGNIGSTLPSLEGDVPPAPSSASPKKGGGQ